MWREWYLECKVYGLVVAPTLARARVTQLLNLLRHPIARGTDVPGPTMRAGTALPPATRVCRPRRPSVQFTR